MKKLKLWGFLLIGLGAILLLTSDVQALENHEDLIKIIAPDGKNAVFKTKKPTNDIEGDILINGYVNNLLQEEGIEGYYVFAGCYESPYTSCTIEVQTEDYGMNYDPDLGISGWSNTYTINVTYDEPEANSLIDNYFDKLNDSVISNPRTYYFVEDLSLINYYLTSEKSELWNPGASGRALKYSTLNNVTNGANITYFIDIRGGIQEENLMFESAFGPMSIFYNGYLYGTKEEGLYLKRVIYIPEDTEDTKEAFVAAAQKRINDYLGNDSVVVSYGGLLSSLPEDSEDIDYPIESDGNYYNIKISNRTYKFYIVKGTKNQLIEPTYVGFDLNSKIEITSEDSSIPLDTSITVKDVNDSSIKDKIGTENYKTYDISLYSNAKGAKIEKLDNGKFLVKIPVPTELNEKDLIVYYIASDGTKEEHEVTIKDGYAIFETNHFSTYVLAEKTSSTVDQTTTVTPEEPTTSNPQTNDNINTYIVMLIVGTLGVVSLSFRYLKNKR